MEGFLNKMDNCRGRIWKQRGTIAITLEGTWRMVHLLTGVSNLQCTHFPLLNNFTTFQTQFKAHFGTLDETGLFLRKLCNHTQMDMVHSYISKFHNIILHLELSGQTTISKFHWGLNDELKHALIGITVPVTLEQLKPKVIQIDNNLHEYNMEKNLKTKTSSNNSIHVNNHPSTSSFSTTHHPMIPGTEVVPMEMMPAFKTKSSSLSRRGRGGWMGNCVCMQGVILMMWGF